MKKLEFNLKSNRFLTICAIGSLLVSTSSCTDLEIEETDSIISAGFTGVENPDSFVEGIYVGLNGRIGDQANLYALSEVTTDELLIPTRGTDWGDNGIWRQLHQHTWTAEHQFITNVWNQWNETQLAASQVLDERSSPSAQNIGDASFLRALSMFVILDNFGQIPFRDTSVPSIELPQVLTGQEAVDFIVADLERAISNLPSVGPNGNTRFASKAAAQYLLAKVYLNKHVYLGNDSADSADMQKVVSLVDEINGEGFDLVEGYFDIFKKDLDKETIWWIPTGVGNRIWNTLHYNQGTEISGGGWNGFATLAEFYDLFEGDANENYQGSGQEERRGFVPKAGTPIGQAPAGTNDSDGDGFADGSNIGNGFLINQQYAYDGSKLQDRAGNPLVFTREYKDANGNTSLINNSERTGIRVIKYNPRFGGFTEHEIFFRYSDAYLMKAEAKLRMGEDVTAMVNTLRELRKATALASVTEQDLLDERGRELYGEFWRRNDMIRFGQFTRDWMFKDDGAVGNENLTRFPIPATQLNLNPNLTQNPGY
ncbi:RagB/SusD family nutrient uptake outer membrane protein [Christiangramia salexigens]|uniref:RagB/SusD family nutrient uptake outer membrane protein n=1 Tax=Christiangramia salexigens TaxID=1913577 RepID=A0A1L3J3Q7_9FLAO|nr:RagB/SusD family nutrient uptake outer membrane protein [Christiangramia salexigens]APG59757.1 RagB/SusD family nutrient uptake outer membrane protein [Christiangramia salexigens]